MDVNNCSAPATDITVGCALDTAAAVCLKGKVNKARVARAALGEMLAAPGVAALSPLAAGCLVLLTRHAVMRNGLENHG
jgi:hypothetical protein